MSYRNINWSIDRLAFADDLAILPDYLDTVSEQICQLKVQAANPNLSDIFQNLKKKQQS